MKKLMIILSCFLGLMINLFTFAQSPVRQANTTTQLTADEYLQLAAAALPPRQQAYQVLAAQRLYRENNLQRAQQIIDSINSNNLPQDISFQKTLLNSKILLANDKPQEALNKIESVKPPTSLSASDKANYHETLANIHAQLGHVFKVVFERNILNDFLSNPEAQQQNQMIIWNQIQTLPPEKLKMWLSEPLSPNMKGWLSLANIVHEFSKNPPQLENSLSQWRSQFPQHPGNIIQVKATQNQQAQKIYLLLPLSGKFAESSKAIRDGFLSSYAYANENRVTNSVSVNVIDTSNGNIADHYQRATKEGANFIVGPLTKTDITELSKTQKFEVPTLALSEVSGLVAPNLFHIGLSQHEEAAQVASHALQEGYRNAIIISPKTDWGLSIANQFKSRWQYEGGNIVDHLAFEDNESLSENIRKLLRVDRSETREKELHKLLNKNLRFVPRRRQDVDMIFLVANSEQARNIMPSLKFYYANNLPVYATSTIYKGIPEKDLDGDLDQIKFVEMPWVLNNLPQELQNIQQKTKSLAGNTYNKNPKLYALGVDAYLLSNKIANSNSFPHLNIEGATGKLYLDANRHVYRELSWTQMRNGQPVLLH